MIMYFMNDSNKSELLKKLTLNYLFSICYLTILDLGHVVQTQDYLIVIH